MEQLAVTTLHFEETVSKYLKGGWLVKFMVTTESRIHIIFERPRPKPLPLPNI